MGLQGGGGEGVYVSISSIMMSLDGVYVIDPSRLVTKDRTTKYSECTTGMNGQKYPGNESCK